MRMSIRTRMLMTMMGMTTMTTMMLRTQSKAGILAAKAAKAVTPPSPIDFGGFSCAFLHHQPPDLEQMHSPNLVSIQ